jgi:hypothetical protein
MTSPQMITDDEYSDIKAWLKVIASNKKRSKIFYAESEDAFIADGKLFKMLPAEYSKYATFDEFYVHVNVKNKEVLYHAWNIENFDELRRSTIEDGVFEWGKVESVILSFLTTNITKLSYSASTVSQGTSASAGSHNSTRTHTQFPQQYGPPYKPSSYSYNEADYKERDAARDKFVALIKQNKTGAAVELVQETIIKLCEAKKFGSLDLFIISLPVETMNIPSMLSVLKATRGADHLLKDRRPFFVKVKERMSKSGKLNKMLYLLDEVEPGKEYAGVTKYSNEPTETKVNAPN